MRLGFSGTGKEENATVSSQAWAGQPIAAARLEEAQVHWLGNVARL